MPRVTTAWASSAVMSWPANEMVPLRDGKSPAMVFMRVVLPAPLEPMTVTISPSPTRSDTSSSAWMAP